jgi:hypothetical protein
MVQELPHLQTVVANLLPSTCSVGLTEITMEQEYVPLQLTTTAPTAACPCCAVSSSSIHSRYQRHLTDLPWGTCTVRMPHRARKFVGQNPRCERHLFTEHLPELVAGYARKTRRLINGLRAIGVALGGNAGARLAARLRLSTSPATVLCLVQTAPVPHPLALQAIGVDAWAGRRGHRDGTILVNLTDHRVVDLLPARSAAIGTAMALTSSTGLVPVTPRYRGRRGVQPTHRRRPLVADDEPSQVGKGGTGVYDGLTWMLTCRSIGSWGDTGRKPMADRHTQLQQSSMVPAASWFGVRPGVRHFSGDLCR